MSLRVALLVGDKRPSEAHLFDLVGAYPRISADLEAAFYENIAQRLVTAQCSGDVTKNEILNEPISAEEWAGLNSPPAMRMAGSALDTRGFFTDMVVIDSLVDVPALNDAIASQYSEGCYSTWEPKINGLISTITGSARPVSKGVITDNELAVIVAAQQDGKGVVTRPVSGFLNSPPSSEAFEMFDMDEALPKLLLADPGTNGKTGDSIEVPVVRSKLHGHRGISTFDPSRVAFAPLEEAFYHFPVTCGSAAQAKAIKTAFSRCDALQNPEDPRMIAFTILPGHGLFIAEKWNLDKQPFQLIWEAMDDGSLQIQSQVSQGQVIFSLHDDGLFRLSG